MTFTIRTKDILVKDLTPDVLETFFEGMPFRYDSVVDLIYKGDAIKCSFLDEMKVLHTLRYRTYIFCKDGECLPILSCLQVENDIGGMLSTFLHDHDRDLIEGGKPFKIEDRILSIWRALLNIDQFSFFFPLSTSANSQTENYMRQAGFKLGFENDLRMFYSHRTGYGKLFLVMQRFIECLTNTNAYYQFDKARFARSKSVQSDVIRTWIEKAFYTRSIQS